jgi:hypothetical protein
MEAVSTINSYYYSIKSALLLCWPHSDGTDSNELRALVFEANVISYYSNSKGKSLTLDLFILVACFKMLWTPVAMPHNRELSTPKALLSWRVLPNGSLELAGPKGSMS